MAFMGILLVNIVFLVIAVFLIRKLVIHFVRNLKYLREEDEDIYEPKIISKAQIISKYIASADQREYHVIFLVSNERKDLCVFRNEYELFEEGDVGILTFQGTYYISFERKI